LKTFRSVVAGPQLPQLLLLLVAGVAANMAVTGQAVMAIQRRSAAGQPQRKAADVETAEAPPAKPDGASVTANSAPAVPKKFLAAAWGELNGVS